MEPLTEWNFFGLFLLTAFVVLVFVSIKFRGGKMKVGKYNLTKEKIDQLPKEERLFFIQILNLLNDLNTFQKLLFASARQGGSGCKVQEEGQNVMSASISLALLGMIIEGWNLIDTATKQESLKEYGLLKEEYLKDFNKHFGKNGGLRKIRNKFINHYDAKSIEEYYQNSDILDFNLVFSDSFGFNFSTIRHMTFTSIFREMGFNPEENGLASCFNELYGLIFESTRSLQKFIIEYFKVVLENYFHDEFEKIEHVELNDLPEVKDINIPFLFK
jgi:hypothetical protein